MAIPRDPRFEVCSTFLTSFDEHFDRCDVLETEGNLIQTWTLGPILHTRVIGYGSRPIWKFFEARTQPLMVNYPKIVIAHDWTRASGYDKKARDECLDFTKQAEENVEEIHMLLDSSLLAMAASVASMLLRKLHIHTKRSSFLSHYEVSRRRGDQRE